MSEIFIRYLQVLFKFSAASTKTLKELVIVVSDIGKNISFDRIFRLPFLEESDDQYRETIYYSLFSHHLNSKLLIIHSPISSLGDNLCIFIHIYNYILIRFTARPSCFKLGGMHNPLRHLREEGG